MTLKYIKNGLPGCRIAFIAPKTASKKAVGRNLLRRRGYFIIKKQLERFPANFAGAFVFGKKSMDFFGGRKNKTKNPILVLENEIKIILRKLKIL